MRIVEEYRVYPVTRKEGLDSLNRHIGQIRQNGAEVLQVISIQNDLTESFMFGLTAYLFVEYSDEVVTQSVPINDYGPHERSNRFAILD